MVLPAPAQVTFFSPINPMPAQSMQVVVPTNGNPITITDVNGPLSSPCGGFAWVVNFELDAITQLGGWIVQEIEFQRNVDTCTGGSLQAESFHFWEAWKVNPGHAIQSLRVGGKPYDDAYVGWSRPNTKGVIKITGKVKFFENVTLPATMKIFNPNTIAGELLSDTAKPAFWNDNGAVDHNLCAVWNCCNSLLPINILTTSRDTGGVNDQDPGQQLDDEENGNQGGDTDPGGENSPRMAVVDQPVVRMIRLLPAWPDLLGSKDLQQIKAIAAELAKLPSDQLRTGIKAHYNTYSSAQNHVQELSKSYLLLRLLFELPEAYDRAAAKTFGGWVHPSVFQSEAYNLSWPIASTEQGLVVEGTFDGYYGTSYNVVAEFDYFAERFPRRAPESIAPKAPVEGLILSLAPNPATDVVMLSTPVALNQQVTIDIVNSFGFRGASEKVQFEQEYFLNVAQLKAGIYFVVFTTESTEQAVKTLIIQR
ncbi:MAG: T9SS type A sorting domain-containing protein [Salibacteraceae bacterium]